MKQELTAKENKFCELIAQGNSQVDAYILAYGKGNSSNNTIKTNAYRLINKPNIQARLAELKEISEKDIKYTKEQSYKKLCEMQAQAEKEHNLNAMLKAEELKGKLFDLYNNKMSVKADIKADASINIQKFDSFKIIYAIDEVLLKEVLAGNKDNETAKMIIEDLKKTETAIITDTQLKAIHEEEEKIYNNIRTITMPSGLKTPAEKICGTIVFDAEDRNC